MSFEEFQDGCPLGYWDRTILAILNLCVTVMPPISGGHLGYQNGTILAILNLCVTDASHQVSAQLDLEFRRRCRFEEFQDPGYRNRTILAIVNLCVTVIPPIPGGHLRYQNGTILAILNLCVTVMPPINQTGFRRRCHLGDVI